MKRFALFLLLSIAVICIGATAVYFINPYGVKTDNVRPRLFGIDIYRIPSKSMQPSLLPGDYIVVSNTAYLNAAPERNDVVVFYKPPEKQLTEAKPSRIPFIKRVLAVAGDTIQIKHGKLWVNKTLVGENYVLPENSKSDYSRYTKLITVPKGHVFVLGDNRDNSRDSRLFGSITVDNVIAKASSILYGKNDRSGTDIE